MNGIELKKLSVDELLTLRDRVTATLESRVDREQQELETRLKRLQRFRDSGGYQNGRSIASAKKTVTRRRKTAKHRKVAPKYRNPAKPSETWAGRGLRPRWLMAALKKGRRIEDFAIRK